MAFKTKCGQFADHGAKALSDLRLAIVKKTIGDKSKAGESRSGGGWLRREGRGEKWSVAEIAKEPAHGVEGLGEMRASAPVSAANCRAVAREPTKRRGDTDRAASVSSDGGDGRSLLHTGAGAA